MPELRTARWKRQIEDRHGERGTVLSAEVTEELLAHLEDVYEAQREQGASDEEALVVTDRLVRESTYRDLAVTRRGRLTRSRLPERVRQQLGCALAETAFDLRYAIRGLHRQATYSLAIIAVLGIGLGATLSAAVLIRSVLLRPLPYPAPGELVVLTHGRAPEVSRAFAAADRADYAAHRETLTALAGYASWPMNLTGGGEPERLRSVIVSGDFFWVLGVAPALGRVTLARDDDPAAPSVVVLSDGFWRRRFGADPRAIGAHVVLNGRDATVVGVMPPYVRWPTGEVDLWMPMGLSPEVLSDRSGEWVSFIGRLRAGVTPAAAQGALSVTSAQLAATFPRPTRDTHVAVVPLLDDVVGGTSYAIWLGGLSAVLALVAGIASAANLMLARATVRRDEMAIRAALGAAPGRLARQVIVEAGVLASLGALAGGAWCWAFLRVFVLLADGRVPRVDELGVDGSVLAFSIVATIASALLVGGAAAWLLVHAEASTVRQGRGPRVATSVPLQGGLLGTQLALAMVLVTGGAIVGRGYAATLRVDPGFDTSATTTLQLTLPRSGYPDTAGHVRFVTRALDAIRALPGVTSAGTVSDLPFVGNATHFPVSRPGEPASSARMATVRFVDAGWFRTLRIPLVAGRVVQGDDRGGTEPILVLNRSAADRYGRRAVIGTPLAVAGDRPRTVVGIVGDIRHAGLHADEGPVVYIPYAQKPFDFVNWLGIAIRTRGTPPSELALRSAIATVDRSQPVEAIRTMDEYVARESAPFRFSALVVGTLASVVLLLALAGTYGLTALLVGRRAHELALRMALGATGGSIVILVLRQIARVLVGGTLAGVLGTFATSRLLAATLPDVGQTPDALLTLGAWGLLSVSAGAAALVPALRATWLDPKTILQSE